MGRKPARQEIELSDEDRERLEQITGNPRSMQKHVRRARIIVEPGSGCGPAETMRRTGMSTGRSGADGTATLPRAQAACCTTPPVRRGRRPYPGRR